MNDENLAIIILVILHGWGMLWYAPYVETSSLYMMFFMMALAVICALTPKYFESNYKYTRISLIIIGLIVIILNAYQIFVDYNNQDQLDYGMTSIWLGYIILFTWFIRNKYKNKIAIE